MEQYYLYWKNVDNQTWINCKIHSLCDKQTKHEQLITITPKVNVFDYIDIKHISSISIRPISRLKKRIDGNFCINLKPDEICYVSIDENLKRLEFEIISLSEAEFDTVSCNIFENRKITLYDLYYRKRKNKGTVILELRNANILIYKNNYLDF